MARDTLCASLRSCRTLLKTLNFQEENDSLRCQLEAYKNEVDLVRSELRGELGMKEAQLKVLQQTLQGLQQVTISCHWTTVRFSRKSLLKQSFKSFIQKLLEGQHQRIEDEAKIKELTTRLNSVPASIEDKSGPMDLDHKPASDVVDSSDSKAVLEEGVRITNKEARLIGTFSVKVLLNIRLVFNVERG